MASIQLTRRLDRPGGRLLLGLAASAYLTVKERRPCRVSYDDGMWVHRHGDRTIVESRVVLARPELLDERAAELFLSHYEIRPGDVVVDIGAGVGRETVLFSRLVGPTGRVISIEAHPTTFAMLEETIARNSCTNVTPVHVAIGAEDGEVHFTDDDDHTRNRVAAASGPAVGTPVPARSLASLLDSCDLQHVDFLKMNIEGAEGPAITAFGPRLSQLAHVAISCHDFVLALGGDESYRTKDTVIGALEAAGFEVVVHDDDPRAYARDTVFATAPASDATSQ